MLFRSNWKVTDIVTYKPSQDLKIKPGESPASAIANNFQAFISTALIEGGFSVKYGLGGASGGRERVMLTAYKKHEGFNTQQELLKIMEIYNWSFQPEKTDTERVRSIEEIQSNEQQLDSLLERAKSNGIITDKEIEEIKKEGAHQAKLLEKKIRKKIPFQKNKKCFGTTPEEQKTGYENYIRQCGLWCKMGAAVEVINNNDMEYQLFGNIRTKYPKKGTPTHEVIDGVTTLSGMRWSYDPGINASGKECKWLSMGNANSSHIVPIETKGLNEIVLSKR